MQTSRRRQGCPTDRCGRSPPHPSLLASLVASCIAVARCMCTNSTSRHAGVGANREVPACMPVLWQSYERASNSCIPGPPCTMQLLEPLTSSWRCSCCNFSLASRLLRLSTSPPLTSLPPPPPPSPLASALVLPIYLFSGYTLLDIVTRHSPRHCHHCLSLLSLDTTAPIHHPRSFIHPNTLNDYSFDSAGSQFFSLPTRAPHLSRLSVTKAALPTRTPVPPT